MIYFVGYFSEYSEPNHKLQVVASRQRHRLPISIRVLEHQLRGRRPCKLRQLYVVVIVVDVVVIDAAAAAASAVIIVHSPVES